MSAPAAALRLVPFTASVARYTATAEKRWASTSTYDSYNFGCGKVRVLTVKIWSWKSLNDSQAEQEVSRGYPAFVHNVSAKSQRIVYSMFIARLLTLGEGEWPQVLRRILLYLFSNISVSVQIAESKFGYRQGRDWQTNRNLSADSSVNHAKPW